MATVEKLGNNKVKLTITVDQEAFAKAMQESYIKNVKHYSVPGFRKGKAPRKVIENMYGEGVFYEDAFDQVYGEAYDKAIAENDLIPVDRPEIGIDEIGTDSGVVFTAEVVLKPEVSLGDYKGIEVVKRAYTVEDAEVDALIEKEQEKAARFVEVERPVADGDQVTLDYSGAVDGVKFDGGTAEGQTLLIGSHTFIPGFEEQMVGICIGETKDITVTFPAEYHASELAGKEAVFTVTVHNIQVKEMPALDDEFAEEISEFNTLAELRADKRKGLEERNEQRAKTEMENEALKKAADNATIDVPNVMIERQIDYSLRDISYRLSMSGLSLDDYCKYTGTTLQAMRESSRKDAEDRVRLQLVLEAICKAEGVSVDDEEIDAEIVKFAEGSKLELDKFRSNLKDEDMEYFRNQVEVEKTVKLVMENVVYVDAPAPVEAEKIAEAQPEA